MTADPYADVPAAGRDGEPDPHFTELARPDGTTLTAFYLPPATARRLGRGPTAIAWTLIALLVSASSCGICLTYGPDEISRLFGG